MTSRRPRGVGRVTLLLTGATVALGGCGASAGAVPTPPSSPSSPAAAGSSSPATEPVQDRTVVPSQARRVGSVQPEPPEAVRLPGTDLLPVSAVGTRDDGLLDVPADVDRLGWWEGGAKVGDPFGSVLLAGHVDSATEGLGPSAVLLTVSRGEELEVRTASRTRTYRVRSRRLVPLEDLASYPGVLSASGPARLTLVTCAPPFLPDAGGYQNLAVVTARPVGAPGR